MSDFNLDSLLDAKLDDLKDVPEFKPYPAGAHILMAKLVDKATDKKDHVNGHPAYSLDLVYKEPAELPAGVEPPAPGSKTNILFMLDNEIGQGMLKKYLMAVAEKSGSSNVRQLIEEAKEPLEVLMVTKVRQNKEKTQSYTDMVEVKVL